MVASFKVSIAMFRNHLKIALRNLARNKVFSFINIIGLATGLAICLLIMLYVLDEISYDKHNNNLERLYRIANNTSKGTQWAALAAPVAWGLKNDMPEIEQVTRVMKAPNMDKVLFKYEHNNNKKSLFESDGYYVDSTFFQVLTYDFTYGNPLTALNQPNTVVIGESLAGKLFGKENPIGKAVQLGLPFGEFTYTIQGVFKDNQCKSHIPARFFMSMRNGDIGQWVATQTNWATNNIFHTYILLKEGTNARQTDQKLAHYMEQRAAADMKALGVSKTLFMQPVKDIYLHSNIGNEIGANGNSKYLYILGSIAAFILFIACINFMNLSTARSAKRAKEVGVRKVMGAEKQALIRQFLGESFIMCLMSLLLALLLTTLLLPLFNNLTQKNLRPFNEPALMGWMTGLTVLTGLLAGLYPAFYLSSFKPVLVLKGKILNGFSATAIRKGLVVFQFTISVALILGAIVIWRQLHFLKNQDLGFNTSQQIVLPMYSKEVAQNYTVLKNELIKNPQIKTVTSGSTYPGIPNINDMLFYAEGKTIGDVVDIHLASIEEDYFKTLGLQVLYGRSFSKDFTADENGIIINEAACKELGYDAKTAPGRKLNFDWQDEHRTMVIVGVVKDFNFESLHNTIKPFGYSMNNWFANKYTYTIINTQSNTYAALLADIEKTWNSVNPATPFTYSFLDQDFQRNYDKEQRTASMILYFTCMAIFIACLGLFGLAAFSAEQRTKEIGIRKVLGASATGVTLLLSKDFIRLVLVAIIIASPMAWYGMNKWLQNFAYQVHISWWMFVAAGCVAIVIALLTISFQSLKAALSNPVNALRSE
jgi:putative ABC transport system permease protein